MTDYTKLVKELRGCKDMDYCTDCPRMANGYVEFCNIKDDAADAIEELQAQLPKRGEWIGKSDDDSIVKCSVCGHIRIGSSLWYCKQYVPYCENCGAKMEVQDGQK